MGAIRLFVSFRSRNTSIPFTPAELYLLFQQNGICLPALGSGKTFVKALDNWPFPWKEEIEKFVNAEPSLVDQFVQDATQTLEGLDHGDKKSELLGSESSGPRR